MIIVMMLLFIQFIPSISILMILVGCGMMSFGSVADFALEANASFFRQLVVRLMMVYFSEA